jgi:Protein of unknown function (DUF3617)
MRTAFNWMCLSGSLLAVPAAAQTPPPIKPGLWQMQSTRLVDGQKAPDPTAQMKNLPPETRARMEQMLKQQGVDIGGDGVSRICLSPESFERNAWQGGQNDCKTDFTSRTGNRWTWKSTCTQPPSESEGEAIFTDPENYTVRHRLKMHRQGQLRTSDMTVTGKWLNADCGDLKAAGPPKGQSPKPAQK